MRWHWSVTWDDVADDSRAALPIIRAKRGRLSEKTQALGCRFIQRRWEKEEENLDVATVYNLTRNERDQPGIRLLHGWHYPDSNNGEPCRWSHRNAWFQVTAFPKENGEIVIRGHAHRGQKLAVVLDGKVLKEEEFQPGYLEFRVPISAGQEGAFRLTTDNVWRPLKDQRTLGIWISGIELRGGDGSSIHANLMTDFRSLGRQFPEEWQRLLTERCLARPTIYGKVFDRLRGPIAKGLNRELARHSDAIAIFCNLPWATISSVRQGDMAMALWHVDDEFYYWRHWIDALRRARLVLANTPYTEKEFFPSLGIRAAFVGPPIWEPKVFPEKAAVEEFRRHVNIHDHELLVLTVCRKSGEKRYDAIAQAVSNLRRQGMRLRMVGVGPDADGRPFDYEGCIWMVGVNNERLQVAYAACDIFAFMSESESFGMVIPEAWHHGKPVIVNRHCAPAASIVEEGVDGLLATPGGSLEAAIRRLVIQHDLRRSLGEAGRKKAQTHYVRGAAAKRFLDAIERTGDRV